MPKVVFCIPSISGPFPETIAALEASVPLVEAAGYEHYLGIECGPYISHNRATLCRKALDKGADVVVFIDHDMSWDPADLVTLIETEGDVVSGTYRFKKEEEEYMGSFYTKADHSLHIRHDGCIKAERVPAGFLKVTREGVNRFMGAYPELLYGPHYAPSVDLFNHGAHKGTWYGEDYAFCRNWTGCGGEIWLVPNINLNHHSKDKVYPGNYHEFLMRQPGGSKDPARKKS